jgi:hypothetical protein
MFSGSRVNPCGRTDRHDAANNHFSQFCERTPKTFVFIENKGSSDIAAHLETTKCRWAILHFVTKRTTAHWHFSELCIKSYHSWKEHVEHVEHEHVGKILCSPLCKGCSVLPWFSRNVPLLNRTAKRSSVPNCGQFGCRKYETYRQFFIYALRHSMASQNSCLLNDFMCRPPVPNSTQIGKTNGQFWVLFNDPTFKQKVVSKLFLKLQSNSLITSWKGLNNLCRYKRVLL